MASLSYSVVCLALNFFRAAKDSGFDVVLIDTAGRMQDNEVCSSFTINFSYISLPSPASHACLG